MGNRRHLAARSPHGFRATRIMAVAAFTVLAGGCNATNLSSAGAAVAPSMSSPVEQGFAPGSCVELGAVVGRGSRGSLPSDDKLTELALNDLRNRAASLGANVVQHGAPQVRSAGSIDSLFNSTAIVRGTAYRCAQPTAPAASASAPLAATPTDAGAGPGRAPPPDGAAGFLFGTAAPKAEAACTQKGLAWNRDRSVASCSGSLVPLGSPAIVKLVLCAEAVCAIDVALSAEPGQVQGREAEVVAALRAKYGPSDRTLSLTSPCAGDLKSCLPEAGVAAPTTWTWSEGFRVEERLTEKGVELSYSNPAWAKELASPAAAPTGPAF